MKDIIYYSHISARKIEVIARCFIFCNSIGLGIDFYYDEHGFHELTLNLLIFHATITITNLEKYNRQ